MKFIDTYLTVKASTPQETGRLLTEHVQEVDNVETTGIVAKGVVTGKVVDLQQHPNADRLRVLSVDVGKEIIDIVTGSPNVTIGQIIPVALPGAEVRMLDHNPDNEGKHITTNSLTTVTKVSLRGIESPGMICGPDEIGLSDTFTMHVHVFPENTPLGVPIESIIESKAIIETDDKGTAHRPDLLSYKGIEQELAAILDKTSIRPFPSLPQKSGDLTIMINAPDACSLFLAAKIENFKTLDSPQWLKDFLNDHDIKVINLPTDVTNYVMLTEGGSTHAFGAEHIHENTLTVRFAKDNEHIETLNNRQYELSDQDLVIADTKQALDVAGIIGGKHTSVEQSTKAIILTSIVVDAATIRRTGRRLNIRTDALVRRERGQSTASSINAFMKIIEHLQEISGADVKAFNYAGNIATELQTISIDLTYMNRFLSTSFAKSNVITLLKRLHYNVKEVNNILAVTPPWWRSDVHLDADVYEDIARIHGYNKLPTRVRLLDNTASTSKQHHLTELLRRAASESLYEIETSSATEGSPENAIEIKNPIGTKKYIRQTLLPELFKMAEQYTREGYENYGCFEIGKTYRTENNEIVEKTRFSACIVDEIETSKSSIAHVLHRLHIPIEQMSFVPCDQSEMRASRYDAVAKIFFNNMLIGNMCVNEIRGKTYCGFKLYIEALTDIAYLEPRFKPYGKFPRVKRDIAFVVDKSVLLGTIAHAIKQQSPLIEHIELFDQFSGRGMDDNQHSLAFHINFQSPDRTLTDVEVNEIISKIEDELKNTFKVTIRE